jgi:hypothetical protein
MKLNKMKITSFILCICILLGSGPTAFAQKKIKTSFKINTLISKGEKSKQISTTLKFSDTGISTVLKNDKNQNKEFNYADIVGAEYSYSYKPVLTRGQMILVGVFFGSLIVPLLFLKKKEHWLSVITADDFIVLRLEHGNYKRIIGQFEAHNVAVKSLEGNEDLPVEKKND